MVQIFIQSAHQHRLPKAFDGPLGLAVALQPSKKVFVCFGQFSINHAQQRASDGIFVSNVEEAGSGESGQAVKRRRQE